MRPLQPLAGARAAAASGGRAGAQVVVLDTRALLQFVLEAQEGLLMEQLLLLLAKQCVLWSANVEKMLRPL